MARKYALIPCDIWHRPTFRGLSSTAQLVYFVIRSSSTTSRAGVTAYEPGLWMSSASSSREAVIEAVRELISRGLAEFDGEHGELFVPDCIRDEEAGRNQNVLERVISDVEVIRSPRLRASVIDELRALKLHRANEAADSLERGEQPPSYRGLRLTWAEREHVRKMRRRFLECAGRRRLRAEIDAGIHACSDCGSAESLQVDHVVALARGGTNDFFNLQVLCAPCNNRKGAR